MERIKWLYVSTVGDSPLALRFRKVSMALSGWVLAPEANALKRAFQMDIGGLG
jgi:hypothetical protein